MLWRKYENSHFMNYAFCPLKILYRPQNAFCPCCPFLTFIYLFRLCMSQCTHFVIHMYFTHKMGCFDQKVIFCAICISIKVHSFVADEIQQITLNIYFFHKFLYYYYYVYLFIFNFSRPHSPILRSLFQKLFTLFSKELGAAVNFTFIMF